MVITNDLFKRKGIDRMSARLFNTLAIIVNLYGFIAIAGTAWLFEKK